MTAALANRVTIGIDAAQREALGKTLGLASDAVQAAARLAAINTALWLRGAIAQQLLNATPAIKEFWERRLLAFLTTGTDFIYGRVFIGLYRPAVAVRNFPLASMFQRGQGAYLRQTYFPGGFIATMPNGTAGIFARTGKRTASGKAAIAVQKYEDLPGAAKLIAQWEEKAIERYREEFDKALKFES